MAIEYKNDKRFIEKLALPLLGLSEEEVLFAVNHITVEDISLTTSSASSSIDDFYLIGNKKIIFNYLVLFGEPSVLEIEFENELDDESYRLLSFLFKSYALYGRDISGKYINNALINEQVNELIVQKGLFAYMLNDKDFKNNNFDKLFKCLQRWSEKTYEGHNVCYGFLINQGIEKSQKPVKIKSECFGNFIDFIGEEYSAVFTDGITSIVEIDSDCDFVSYRSTLHSDKPMPDNFEGVRLPIRFAQIIYENVVDDKIGLFLLTNGDIIFAKDRSIAFVKRGGRWLNFSQKAFYDIISKYVSNSDVYSDLIKAIYCSCLDISFAHSGGLIAVVDTNKKEWEEDLNKDNPIITKLDTISKEDFELFPRTLEDIYYEEKKKIDTNDFNETIKNNLRLDLNKRITKKRYLLQILKDNIYFPKIDRKLRADLSGLDGAIIIDLNGNIIACGAIIANKSGSSGGGRGSAARTLSKYGGFSIKISTDGYIEAFVDESRVYSIK